MKRPHIAISESDVKQAFPWVIKSDVLSQLVSDLDSLAAELGVADISALKVLYNGLNDAASYQEMLGGVYDAGIAHREMADALTSITKALFKIEQHKGSLAVAQDSINRAIKVIPDAYLHALDTVSPALLHLPPLDAEKSNFEIIAISLAEVSEPERGQRVRDLQSAVVVFIEDLKKTGKGGARRDARRQIAGITKLAEWFGEALPDYELSAGENSLFYKYVVWWFSHRLKITLEYPERHIRNALAEIARG